MFDVAKPFDYILGVFYRFNFLDSGKAGRATKSTFSVIFEISFEVLK